MLNLKSALSLLTEYFQKNDNCLVVYFFGSYSDFLKNGMKV
jgi:hypothetical protein